MKIYLAGFIQGSKLKECCDWRVAIRKHYGDEGYTWLDPLNGKDFATITDDGLKSSNPAQAIVHRDYVSVHSADLIVANMDTFGEARPLTGCYDNETEILTDQGWKYFKELNKTEKVYTINKNNEIELQQPIKYYEFDYNNNLYYFKAKGIDLAITPNHNLVVDKNCNNKISFIRADNMPKKVFIPKQSIWAGKKESFFTLKGYDYTRNKLKRKEVVLVQDKKVKMDDWVAFLGIWLAEGCVTNTKREYDDCRVIITAVNKRKKKLILKMLNRLPFKFHQEKANLVINNKQLYLYLKKLGNCYTKYIPEQIKCLDKKYLKILFSYMMLGDGHVNKKHGQKSYYTSSKALANDVQEILLKIGEAGNLFTDKNYNKKSSINGRTINKTCDSYIVRPQKSNYFKLKKEHLTIKKYKGKVYCVEVPNHSLYVRRQGKSIWCGNTICELAWAWDKNIPIIMITTENKYKEHPFLSCFASWIVGSVDEMIDRGAIEYFKGGIENAIY